MKADEVQTGSVVLYRFLWSREHASGEEHGRKPRPACVVVPVNVSSGTVALFPLTTQPPRPDRLALGVPDTERRRLKLRGSAPTWIMLDEGNTDELAGSYYIEPISHDPMTYVYGRFSGAFMVQVLRTLAEAIRAKRLKLVQRQD